LTDRKRRNGVIIEVAVEGAMTESLPQVLREMTAVIGKKLTAYIGASNHTQEIDRWVEGISKPDAATEKRLRFAHRIVMMLLEKDSPEVVQAWLIGINPELGDRTAIRMLREDPLDVAGPSLVGAARAFATGG
jgi:hypothetical protein